MSLTQLQTDPDESAGTAFYDVRLHFENARLDMRTSQLAFLLMGRGRSNDLLVEDCKRINLEVSKVHAALTCDANFEVAIMDVSSTNGTFVNGARLLPYVPRPLRDGDVVRFGHEIIEEDGFTTVNPLAFLWSSTDPPAVRPRVRPRAETVTRESALENMACPMCTEPMVSARVLACGHASCHACLAAWFTPTRRTCPVCRAEQPAGVRPVPCQVIDALVAAFMNAGGSVAERAAYARRVAHAKMAEDIRERCARIGAAKE
jgi:hypothetical protein